MRRSQEVSWYSAKSRRRRALAGAALGRRRVLAEFTNKRGRQREMGHGKFYREQRPLVVLKASAYHRGEVPEAAFKQTTASEGQQDHCTLVFDAV